MSSKNYPRWKQKKQKSAEEKEEVSAELQEQQKLDPRVNVFCVTMNIRRIRQTR